LTTPVTTIGAVDIGGTKIAVGIVDDKGRILARTEVPSSHAGRYHDGLALIVAMLRETAQSIGATLSGIGIGSTGPVSPLDGSFGDIDFLPLWKGGTIVADLSREFQLPVALENDADAAALAEATWGAGKSKSRLIYVTVGTGIGGGIVLDGELYRGVDLSHPEIGHQVLEAEGPACSCGLNGCWEALAAGPAMERWMASQPGVNSESVMSAQRIYELSLLGNETAAKAVAREHYFLGIGLANLINLFCPDALVLSGSVMKSARHYLNEICEVISRGCRFVPVDKVHITLASLGQNANLAGAACVWHNRYGKTARSA